MSDEKEKSGNPFADSMNAFRGMYEQMMKQSEKQWEEVARNPLFVAQMANNFEQSMQVHKQLREMLDTSLKALNLPSKDDILLLAERVNQLRTEIAEVNTKLDILVKEKKAKKKNKQG
jgi:hypothetical protein